MSRLEYPGKYLLKTASLLPTKTRHRTASPAGVYVACFVWVERGRKTGRAKAAGRRKDPFHTRISQQSPTANSSQSTVKGNKPWPPSRISASSAGDGAPCSLYPCLIVFEDPLDRPRTTTASFCPRRLQGSGARAASGSGHDAVIDAVRAIGWAEPCITA